MRLSRLPAVLSLLVSLACSGQPPAPAPVKELSADERMGWWRDARADGVTTRVSRCSVAAQDAAPVPHP